MVTGTDHKVETGIKITIGEEETTAKEVVIETVGPIIGIAVGPETGTVTEMVTGIPIDQITEGKTVVKGMVIETTADPGIEIEIGGIGVAPERAPNPEAVPQNRYKTRRQSRDDNRNKDRSESRSRSSSHVSSNRDRSRCYRYIEYDHFVRECPNDTPGRNSSDAKGFLLRMTDTDQAYALDYTDGEDFDMNLNM